MTGWADVLVAGLVGLAFGSFLNVVADRLPAGQSLLSPPSHCPSCGSRLRALDLVPLLSYLSLRGRCRYCASPIPFRVFLVELATGAAFASLWAAYGPTYQGIALLGYACFFMAVLVIDLEHQIIPNKLVLPGVAAALAVGWFWPGVGPVGALIGAAVGFGAMLLLYVVPGAVIGEGDVKLTAVVGAGTGFPVVVLAIMLAFTLGGLVALLLLASGRAHRKQRIPFGPFIAVAALASLVWGQEVVAWYLGLAGAS